MRPKKERIVNSPPKMSAFKPAGIPSVELEKVVLSVDEYEAVRLADLEKLDHSEASDSMEISRPTFSRLIEKARYKIADAVVNCKQLVVEGGKIHFKNNIIECLDCGEVFKFCMSKTPNDKCRKCGSKNIKNLAMQFGHGKCCRNRFRGKVDHWFRK